MDLEEGREMNLADVKMRLGLTSSDAQITGTGNSGRHSDGNYSKRVQRLSRIACVQPGAISGGNL